jgi:ribosomal peptide maturation radical SAM protein 1
MRAPTVALVNMPFAVCWMPSAGLGLLKGALAAAGIPSAIYHFDLDIMPDLGANVREALAFCDLIMSPRSALVAEWLFSAPHPPRDERYTALLLDKGFTAGEVARLAALRPRLDARIATWAERIVAAGHDIVGFTCSLDRTRASVRLAEAIRTRAPGTRLIAGGFGASGEMGRAILEAFDVFDLVCHTEADELIAPIVEALRGNAGRRLDALPGISYRSEGGVVSRPAGARHVDLERAPMPDYDDYVDQVAALRASWDPSLDLPQSIPLETARGCWWGARAPCIFCSLNGQQIGFRAKSPARVLEEVAWLRGRYGNRAFVVVDNILDAAHFDTLLPELATLRPRPALFWEVRPNLRRAEVRALARAGVTRAQPGIESLSTPALRVMRKGTTAIENIQALKWLAAHRIDCTWNFLFSLPGERIEWYEDVARLIPRVAHLPPPSGLRRIALQRFSPLFAHAADAGVDVKGPTASTRLVFGDVREDLVERLAYNFEYEFAKRPKDLDARITGLLEPLIEDWRLAYERRGCTKSIVHGPGESLVILGSVSRPERLIRLRGPERAFLHGCGSIRDERELLQALSSGGTDEAADEGPLESPAYRRLTAELASLGAGLEDVDAVDGSDVVACAEKRAWIYRERGRVLSLLVDQTHLARIGSLMFDVRVRPAGPPTTPAK